MQAGRRPVLGYKAKGDDGGILANKQSPLANINGIDTRPILTCFIGIILAIVLNKLTSYYTHTTHEPGEDLGAGLPDGPRHEHHPGLCRGL